MHTQLSVSINIIKNQANKNIFQSKKKTYFYYNLLFALSIFAPIRQTLCLFDLCMSIIKQISKLLGSDFAIHSSIDHNKPKIRLEPITNTIIIMKKFLHEFKEFAMRGNMIDMAVGIIIGAAFGKIVSSLVSDIIMPPLGLLIGGVDFSNLAVTLKHAVGDDPAVVLKYGAFIQTVVDFTIIALAIFMLIRVINTMRRKSAAAAVTTPATPPTPTTEEKLLTEIRDLLKANQQSEHNRK